MSTPTKVTGTPGPPKVPGKPKAKRKVRKMANPPEPVKDPDRPPKPKRKPQRTKRAGWQKGIVRSACLYVQDPHHQAVNLAASALRVSKGIVAERALVAYLKDHPELGQIRPALKAILGNAWDSDQGDETGGE